MKVRIIRAVSLLALLTLAGTGLAAAPAATLVVTNVNDSGVGSLRQALLDSNASVGVFDTITFNIAGSGVQTIVLTSALPDITDPVFINGRSQPGYDYSGPLVELDGSSIAAPNAVLTISSGNCEVSALAINRGPDAGIRIRTQGNNNISRCAIGTDPTGTIARGNATHGVVIENVPGNSVNSIILNAPNVIGGNGMNGVLLTGAAASGNAIDDNVIGADWTTGVAVPNGGFGIQIIDGGGGSVQGNVIVNNAAGGVRVQGSSTNVMVKKNTISSNGGPGVGVLAPAVGVAIQNNILASNTGLGIDLGVDGRTTNDALDADTGANFLQNYAVLTKMEFGSVDSAGNRIAGLTGTLQAEPLTNYRFDVYQGVEGPSPDDPQVTINNTVFQSITFTTDATGFGSFVMSVDLHAGARIVTGTITDPIGSTSELSPAFRVPDLEVKSAACGASGLEALLPLLLAALRRRRRNRS